jgi:carboxyl-terminal processing protease
LTTGKWYTPSGRSIQAEHAGMNDARFVSTDTLINRPMFRSVSGRPIVGGGGVTPDVVVRQDTASSAERELARAVGAQIPLMQDLVLEVAREVAGTVRNGDFSVPPAWRDTLRARLAANEVVIADSIWTSAEPVVDRLLAGQVAGLAIGDSVAFLRQAPADAQLRTARELILQAGNRTALLGLAAPDSR